MLHTQFSQFSSVVSHSLQPHGLHHARLPCLSPTPKAYSNSCPSSQCCHPTILCPPLLLLPSIFPSLRVFSNESALCTRWPKYWSFSFSISPSDEYSGLISFRIDWFDLFAVQVTLKSLLQLLCTTGPDLFTDFTHETWFTGNQERPLLKCFSDCALTIRKQVRKVLGNPWTYYELHYFDGRLSCLIVENNDLKV